MSRNDFVDLKLYESELVKIGKREMIHFLPHTVRFSELGKETVAQLAGILPSGQKANVTLEGLPISFEIFPLADYSTSDQVRDLSRLAFERMADQSPLLAAFAHEVGEFIDATGAKDFEWISVKIFNKGMQRRMWKLGARLYYSKTAQRKAAIIKAREKFYITGNGDIKKFMLAKHDKPVGSWATIADYVYKLQDGAPDQFSWNDPKLKWENLRTKAEVSFLVRFESYIGIDPDEAALIPVKNVAMSYDIETYQYYNTTDQKAGVITSPTNSVFNIGIYVATTDRSKEHSYNIYYTIDGKKHPEIGVNTPDATDIPCVSERELILAFVKLFERIQPDFLLDYNGRQFDLPQIMMKARLLNIFDEVFARMSLYYVDCYCADEIQTVGGCKYQVRKGGWTNWQKCYTTPEISGYGAERKAQMKPAGPLKKFKIENNFDLAYHEFPVPGCVHIDMFMMALRKNAKVADRSMNAFLAMQKIPLKLDMDYAQIWQVWSLNKLDQLTDVFRYCIYDAKACFLLAESYMFLAEKRQLSYYTGLPLDVIMYQADGVKIVSMTIKSAYVDNYVCVEELPRDTGRKKIKNQGALVMIHRRGKIHFRYPTKNPGFWKRMGFEVEGENGLFYALVPAPVVALDFRSLYPSIFMAFNLSPETITQDIEEITTLLSSSSVPEPIPYKVHYDESLPEEYNRDIYIANHFGETEKMGVLPKFLARLFDLRVHTKKQMAQYYAMAAAAKTNEERDLLLTIAKVYGAKEQAIKILMNTTYGVSGQPTNVIYEYLVAFLTTYYGRVLIQKANDFLRANGDEVCYNDTDSAYYVANMSNYLDILGRFENEEFDLIALDRKLVERATKLASTESELRAWYKNKPEKLAEVLAANKAKFGMPSMVDALNKVFADFSGTNRLEMVYEETLLPVVFLAKKRYCGNQHARRYQTPTPKTILYRGLTVRSRKTNIFCGDFTSSLSSAVLQDRSVDVQRIVYKQIEHNINNFSDDPELYENKSRYKPSTASGAAAIVKNCQELAERINEPAVYAVCVPPLPLEYIRYVVAETKIFIDFKMRIYHPKITERTFYTDLFKMLKGTPNELVIDKEYYVMSLMAPASQFLTYLYDHAEAKESVEAAKKMLVEKYTSESGRPDAYVNIRRKLDVKLYLDWIKSYYTGNILALLKLMYDRQVSLVDKIINSAESLKIKGKMPIEADADLWGKFQARLVEMTREVGPIEYKMLLRFNEVIGRVEKPIPADFGDILSDREKKILHATYKTLIVYSIHNQALRERIKRQQTARLNSPLPRAD